ncbi:hypothetical protein KAK07_04770 [Ideonella sp. 4Y16]|uniref:hypothetical protein n=1 Tax=Ideonella alba TaxID=2824118 RepID=UPI001B3990BD|nr:hypothetical protein [Ideonella alba]MBQ0942640.1 hypothetical protein [Ideonella alba]
MSQELKLAWLQEVLGVGADEDDTPPESGKARKNAFTEALSSAENKLMRLFSTTKTLTDGDTGLDTTRIKDDLAYQRKALENAASITDEGERQAAIERINRRIDEIQAHANALETARKAVMGDSKKAPTDAQKNKIYQQALEDFYGLKLSVPLLMSNTHLDRVFDMMGTVPKGQTGHDKLKKLEYTRDKGWKGSGAYGGGEILMGDFGDATGEETYTVDGKALPANSFDVTMLHEMGHALDDEKKIMDRFQGLDGCGGWVKESLASVVAAMLKEFKGSGPAGATLSDAVVESAIKQVLKGSTSLAVPQGVDATEWNALLSGFLSPTVRPSCEAAEPWFNPPPALADGRCYIESYSNDWWSYRHASVAATKVNKYQWRSPAEWFAEVYAITWLKRNNPPTGVAKEVTEFMFKEA